MFSGCSQNNVVASDVLFLADVFLKAAMFQVMRRPAKAIRPKHQKMVVIDYGVIGNTPPRAGHWA
jgi:hypothetical protein